ncbi:branched-chain amino acid ABC transporter permease [Bradyrhizobium sp. U87765 SZCCT0131]|uniref:branched-chain amino acid ABC transporter permease n=1 Tax=unclassified Bradyrhizobium TaxID=2631580 RepID=UPI001BAAB284|nr:MULTISPECIES: branched-chain amino acid ABC transporter permease [unclassified Bradyrhizobium]MBR1221570.1 branched-chain amino acid ABC transporter permease [Bradyrhizobium sp. U87765 SZCCT0131]MBR1264507.1 branched-chain amino acid ABC transporter permease [Bradyrhizobium sp. U87765 SZCCT0134]MBR1304586.1 branched-chain amino acid ABC transporter permease [Bradyrhizobium sp. U87765 SZCCT0110]MBR1322557.1 branched-chain amino acid ABC transporter permease [Bradyrhizobium sp. U87765 SZCCT010
MTDGLLHGMVRGGRGQAAAIVPMLGIAVAAAGCLVMSQVLGPASLRLLSEILIYLTLAQLWNLLAGYAGLVSVGQQAYVGLGGYAFFSAATGLGLPPLPALLVGGVAGLVAAAVASVFIFRLKGAHFAIGTWVVAEICLLTVAITPGLGSGSGLSLPAAVVRTLGASPEARATVFLALALALATVTIVAIYLLMRSRIGLALVAIRDSERAAEALGVDAMRIKRMVYIAVGFATGVAGGLIFLMKLRMTPDSAFSLLDWTAYVLFIVIIGGTGRIEGPFIGTLIFFVLRTLFAGYGPIYLVVLGAVAVAAMLFAPGGAWGLIARWTNVELFPIRRRPS